MTARFYAWEYTSEDDSEAVHIFEYATAPAAICGLDEAFCAAMQQGELNDGHKLNLCPACKKKLPELDRIKAQGSTLRQADIERRKLEYWKDHGTLAGFNEEAQT